MTEDKPKKKYLQIGERGMKDIFWPYGTGPPKTLVPFNEIKGKWTYPKPGFIQWKNEV